jgi:hypothetical protein
MVGALHDVPPRKGKGSLLAFILVGRNYHFRGIARSVSAEA